MRHSRTTTPAFSSARHGPMLDSWSKSVTTTSSPGCRREAIALARNCASTVVEGPNTTSSGRRAPIHVATRARASASRAEARCEWA